MQVLTMAMKTGNMEDSNGNHASEVSIPGNRDVSGTDPGQQHLCHHIHHHHVSPDAKPLQDKLQHSSAPQLVHPEGAGGPLLESASPDSRQPAVPFSRPGQLFSGGDPPVSQEECSNTFCNMASSAVDSDSSSSPDINSNTLLVGFGDSDFGRCEVDNRTVSQTSEAFSADQDICQKVVATNKNVPPVTCGNDEGQGQEELPGQTVTTSSEGGRTKQDISSASGQTALFESIAAAAEDLYSERGSNPAKQDGDEERTQPHLGLDSTGVDRPGNLLHHEDTVWFRRLSTPTSGSAHISLRHSVDMDVDFVDSEEHRPLADTESLRSHCVPVSLSQSGSAAERHPQLSSSQCIHTLSPSSQSLDTPDSHSQHSALVVPLVVLKQESATEVSSCHESHLDSNTQDSSPQVTRLSMWTLSRTGGTSSPDMSPNAATHQNGAEQQNGNGQGSSWPSHVETKTFLLSSKFLTWTYNSSSNVSLSGDAVSQAVARGIRQSDQFSGRRPEGGQNDTPFIDSRNGDVLGQEERVEEELSMYAHCLLSWSSEMPARADRQELCDPVATLLTEGDSRHFIPIEEDTLNHPTGPHDSADPASHAPG